MAATLLTAVPAVITLVSGFTPNDERSKGSAEASRKPSGEPSETPSNTAPSKPLTELISRHLITVTNPKNGTTMCVDDKFNRGQNGDVIQLWPCDYFGETEGQLWTLHSDNTVRVLGKCLDIVNNSTEKHARLQLWDCNDDGGKRWIYTDDNQLKNLQSGLCLDVPEAKMEKAAALEIYDCLYHSPQAAADAATPPTAGRPFWTQKWHFVKPSGR
ncbi:hypothetical protein GCM10027290_07800 [Micromonospora sonneratiae]|uniref:ricin-type beta-trefoil lectin domain protein n=1 Tax=Micromonospora sonneratiae TaxID=1184706 RepID=UPI00366FACA2